MGILDLFRSERPSAVTVRHEPAVATTTASPRAQVGESEVFYSLSDPRVIEFMREGLMTATGLSVGVETALKNPAMFRACSLIATTVGMLPLNLINKETKKKATDHPVHKILHRRPNGFQSAFDFRSTMQLRALVHGDAYALIVSSRDIRARRDRPIRLVPLDSRRMDAKLNPDWTMRYDYTTKEGGKRSYASREILHIRGMSLDGVNGFSLVTQAKEAISLALSAELAAGRIFKNGSFIDGVLVSKGLLSDPAYERLKLSWEERFSGAGNAGKTPILEEDTDYKILGSTARDAQMSELRKLQVEEIARVTGVPRPLLMVDETAWGTGIFALGQFFVAYALNPWFEAWQQAIERSMLSDEEVDIYEAKFNPGALLRGSLKDQSDYFAKALGAGGHQPWMHYDEVRETLDMPARDIPPNPMMGHNGGPPLDDDEETAKPARKPSESKDDNDD